MLDFVQARRTMVDCQLRTFDVHELTVLAAFEEVPRERFMPAGRESLAYADVDVPVFDGIDVVTPRMMLAPMVLARLIQALDIRPGTRVLDVAGGLGYSAAVLAALGGRVVALESTAALSAAARERLADVAPQVLCRTGALAEGAPDEAPFDAILVNGSVEVRPDRLIEQLTPGGRLVCVERRSGAGQAVIYVRADTGSGSRLLFGAGAPLLPEFRADPGFVF